MSRPPPCGPAHPQHTHAPAQENSIPRWLESCAVTVLAQDLHSDWVMRLLRPIPSTPFTRALRIVALVVVLMAAVFFAVAASEARRLRVDRRDITSPNLPEAFDGLRVVFVADIHSGPNFSQKRIARLFESINRLHPDVLILGGDYVGGRAGGAEAFYSQVQTLEATLGRYAVLGNHDVWEGADEARKGLREAGVTLLENDTVRVERQGQSITIGGVEDLYTGEPDAVELSKGLDPSRFAILVSHNPDVFSGQMEEVSDIWDLGLSGHTHGGQVNFLGLIGGPTRYIHKRFRSGWTSESGVPVLVTNGVGTVTLPLRFFAEPEVHVITLRRS